MEARLNNAWRGGLSGIAAEEAGEPRTGKELGEELADLVRVKGGLARAGPLGKRGMEEARLPDRTCQMIRI